MFLFVALCAAPAQPTIVVENKIPTIVVVNRIKAPCTFCPRCVCKPGMCPTQCPVVTQPTVQYQVQTFYYRGQMYQQLVPFNSTGCANGQCNLKR